MRKVLAVILLASTLAACDLVSTLTEGFKYASAVEDDLEALTGLRPQVDFNWVNGRLLAVTVTFPRLYDAKPVRELAAAVSEAVVKEFKQSPETVVLAFALGKPAPGRAARAEAPPR